MQLCFPMNNLIRNVLSIMAGTFVAVVLTMIVQIISHQMYPAPPGTDFNDLEVLAELMMNAPIGALLMVLLSYAVGTMGGAFVGAKIAISDEPARQGLFVTVLMLIAGLMNLNAFPHPAWFWSSCIVVIVGSGYFGADLGSKREVK